MLENHVLLPGMTVSSATLNHRLAAAVAAAQGLCFLDYQVRPVLCHLLVERRPRLVPPHTHPYCELTLVTGAPVRYYRPGSDLVVQPGQLFLMPPGIEHGWEHGTGQCELWGFMLDVSRSGGADGRRLETAAAAQDYRWTPEAETVALLRLFLRDAVRKSGFVAAAAGALAQAWVAAAWREAFARLPAASPMAPPGQPVARALLLERARHYLRINMSHAPRADEVARHVGVSVRQLHRIFLAEQGCNLGEWFLNERLARAQALLASERDLPVKRVAAECGFHNVSNFCRRFAEQLPYTPAAYRRHCDQ